MRRKSRVVQALMRPFWGVVAALFVLLFGAMAGGALAHHALHHDNADSHSEHCDVCSFAKSQFEVSDGSLPVRQPSMGVDAAAVWITSFVPQSLTFLLPPGRAPPIFPSFSKFIG